MLTTELRDLKKLIISLFIFGIILIIWDNIVGTAITYYIRKMNLNTISGLEYARYQNPDILIFGASQGETGYNSKIISKLTGLKTVNLSFSLSNNMFGYILLKDYLKTNKPKFVVLDFTDIDLYDVDQVLYSTFHLRHLYGEDNDIDSLFADVSPTSKVSFALHMFRYNRLVFDIIKDHPVTEAKDHYKPYEPDSCKYVNAVLAHIVDNPLEFMEYNRGNDKIDINSVSYKYLNEFVQLCRDNKITLILVNSPNLKKEMSANNTDLTSLYAKTLKPDKYISFNKISLDSYPYFKDKKYYKDLAHLNSWGADSLSNIVSRIIIGKIQNQN